MPSLRSYVCGHIAVPGIHQWAGAPRHLHFLGHPHRHLFHIRVTVNSPADDNRSVEFFELASNIRTWISRAGFTYDTVAGYNFGNNSCESIALAIINQMPDDLKEHGVKVSVSEDDENGAVVEMAP